MRHILDLKISDNQWYRWGTYKSEQGVNDAIKHIAKTMPQFEMARIKHTGITYREIK